MDTAREPFPTTPRTPDVSPCLQQWVPVRVWAVRRDVPVSLVPRTVGSNPDPEKDGNRLVGVYPVSFLFGFFWSMHFFVGLGLPCKVINQSIVGLSRLFETA
jgi:hypothetical protein